MQPQGGQREDGHDDGRDQAQQFGVPFDEGGPAHGEAGGLFGPRPLLGQPTALAAAERPHLDQPEQRGQQGDGGGDGQDDGERGGEGDTVEEAQPQDQHAQQRDTHRGTGEDDRPPGHRDGTLGGLLDGQSRPQAPPVAGDDEQRIVDADAEADEHAQHGGEVGDGHGMAEQADPGRGGADGDQRGDDRKKGRGERAEGEEEHHGRHPQPDDFRQLRTGRLGQRDPGAAQLHVEPVPCGGLRRLHHLLDLARVQLVRRPVEDEGGVGGVPVRADLPLMVRRVGRAPVGAVHLGDARQPGDLPQRMRHPLLDGLGPHRPRIRVPHEGVAVPGLPGERLRQQGRGLPGLGPRDLVVGRVRRAHRPCRGGNPREGGEPEDDHHDAVPQAPPSQSGHGLRRLLPGLGVDNSRVTGGAERADIRVRADRQVPAGMPWCRVAARKDP